MPHANPEDRRRYMNARRAAIMADPEKAPAFMDMMRAARRKHRAANLQLRREYDAAHKRRQRANESPEEREIRRARSRDTRDRDATNLYILQKKLIHFGWTLDKYHAALESQDFSCAICEEPFDFSGDRSKRINLDHCHATNRVRGLLCGNCNVGIGHLQESRRIFERATEYLVRHHA